MCDVTVFDQPPGLGPGDTVQVVAAKQDFLGCFAIVEGLQGGVVAVRMPRPMRRMSPLLYFHRTELALIGPAALLGPFGRQSADTHTQARRLADSGAG